MNHQRPARSMGFDGTSDHWQPRSPVKPDSEIPEGATAPRYARSIVAPRLELRVLREAGTSVERTSTVDGDSLRIGSHASNDLVIADPEVSRFHCSIVKGQSAWRVVDEGSLNGTRLGGIAVRDADLPPTSCAIELGGSVIELRELPGVESLEVLDQVTFGELFGTSVGMRRMFALLERVSASDANVLIEGESGTGKELVASEIVRRGERARKPFVIVDCSAISPSLIESELFGHTKGAFTGADRDRVGSFEAAHGGTIFLDEIGELPLELQPKLLRALEQREVRRVGETRPRKVDVRVIAATNRRLEREVNQGRFREDLFFRLSVVTVRVPPLRERPEDLDILVHAFLDRLGAKNATHLFTPELLSEMKRQEWPGNVRELRNFVERTVVLRGLEEPSASLSPGDGAGEAPVDIDVGFRAAKDVVIARFERRYLDALMAWAEGNVTRAARKAKIDRMSLYRLMQRHGVRESPERD